MSRGEINRSGPSKVYRRAAESDDPYHSRSVGRPQFDEVIVIKGERALRRENDELTGTYASKEYSELRESQYENIK